MGGLLVAVAAELCVGVCAIQRNIHSSECTASRYTERLGSAVARVM